METSPLDAQISLTLFASLTRLHPLFRRSAVPLFRRLTR